ncbi:unnamed protein product [Oikopleura dioica]|uniref:EGF-like domain-containing protein n=1 Tax=Oikopleura dioica TaxID=34765 RepID=E4XC56_OIKDI|nr:unnamed protein product [Oikopleura dioica]
MALSGFEISYEIIPPDPCEGVNCNSGSCERGLCNCPANLSGEFCESDFDECASGEPCSQHGVCVNSFGGFDCICLPGYSGVFCEEEINECASDPCRNGGTCLNEEGIFQCICREFFSGERCENTVERVECSASLCSSNGTCQQTNEPPFFRCICEPGASGEGQWQ